MVTTPDRPGCHALDASLIERLHAVQQRHGYLPRAELQQLAVAMQRPLSDVMGEASFITFVGLFSLHCIAVWCVVAPPALCTPALLR